MKWILHSLQLISTDDKINENEKDINDIQHVVIDVAYGETKCPATCHNYRQNTKDVEYSNQSSNGKGEQVDIDVVVELFNAC